MRYRQLSLTIASLLIAGSAFGSSHREAPLITSTPKVDGTNFYMFRSYKPGRVGYVTLIANYQPLQAPYGGPNFFFLDPDALYETHIDNNGDAVEDITFQFRFRNDIKGLAVPVNGTYVPVPLINIGSIGTSPSGNEMMKNLNETFTVGVIRGGRRDRAPQLASIGNSNGLFHRPRPSPSCPPAALPLVRSPRACPYPPAPPGALPRRTGA